MPSFKSWEGLPDGKLVENMAVQNPRKFLWFMQRTHPYKPHVWQTVFHGFRDVNGHIPRFRHLVAGRRGGKTKSAAEDFGFYTTHPEDYWMDFHGVHDDQPLWCWVLAKQYQEVFPAMREYLAVLKNAGLQYGRDFRHHKGEKYIEFLDGTLVQFKTADDPEALRGAGLNILWIDEAAILPNEDAYNVVYPALSDKQGAVMTTTTPKGKNWYYEEFWSKTALADPQQLTIEYMSVDNPYFPEPEWRRAQRRYHPQLFKQEYMARFDALAGIELNGEWLQYYTTKDLPRVKGTQTLDLKLYIGIDPAVSLSDKADRFAMALIGLTQDNAQAYLLDLYADRIPFPEQIEKIREWHLKYRPMLIGIESNAYQAALAQQAMRMTGFPPVIPILSKGKKHERILSMAPLFKIGRIQIHKNHNDFIDEWLNFDSSLKNTKDDTLDAVEIALRTAGALLPEMPQVSFFKDDQDLPTRDIEELAKRDLMRIGDRKTFYDDEMGADW